MAGDSIWLYNPSLPLSIIAAVLYFIPMVIQIYQTTFRYRALYFVPVLIGAMLEVGGYIARAISISQPDQIPPYAVWSSLIVLAPLFVGAGDYVLVSRLCAAVLPANNTKIYRIPTAKLTRIFVTCDIFSFLIQVSGSGIASSGNWKGSTVVIGTNVLLAGLATQVVTFLFFMAIIIKFHLISRQETKVDAGDAWRKILFAVYLSSVLIIIRCIYRLIEFAMGIFGYPFTHEWIFYVFESLPMLPAIAIFCFYHPSKYLMGTEGTKKTEEISLRSIAQDGLGPGGQIA